MRYRMMRSLIFISGGSFLLFLIACARPAPIIPPPVPPRLTQEEIIKVVKKNALTFTSLKSYIKAKIEYPEREKKKLKRQPFEGALLYKKSGETLRLQGLGAFGRILFDFLWYQREVTLYIPSSAVVYNGLPSQIEQYGEAQIFTLLSKIMGGAEKELDPLQYSFDEKDGILWIIDGKYKYALKVNGQTLLVDQKTIFQYGEVTADIFYSNYQDINGTSFPTHMKMVFPPQGITLEFDFDSPVLNDELPDTLFTLSLPSHIPWLPLSNLRLDLFL